MAVATQTFLQMVQAVADDLGLRNSGTLTGSATTSLTCATYPYKTNRANADDNGYEGTEVYITSGSATPNPNGISAYVPSTGVFTPSVTYSVAPSSTATFDIYLRDVRIDEIKSAVNEALRRRFYLNYWPVTIIDDGDMSSSGVTSYTASNATLTKMTTAANVQHGVRSLRVLATADGGYARTPTLNIVDSTAVKSYYVQAQVRSDVGTAKLQAYDVTHGVEIESEEWTQSGWGVVSFEFDVPQGCEQIQLRMIAELNADDTYWNYLMVLPQGATAVPLPDWVNEPGQVQQVYRLPITEPISPYHDLRFVARRFNLRPNTDNANSAYTLEFQPAASGSMWAKVYRPFATLSADADTTFMDREWLILAAEVELLSRLIHRPPSQNTEMWKSVYALRVSRLKHKDATRMPAQLRVQMPE